MERFAEAVVSFEELPTLPRANCGCILFCCLGGCWECLAENVVCLYASIAGERFKGDHLGYLVDRTRRANPISEEQFSETKLNKSSLRCDHHIKIIILFIRLFPTLYGRVVHRSTCVIRIFELVTLSFKLAFSRSRLSHTKLESIVRTVKLPMVQETNSKVRNLIFFSVTSSNSIARRMCLRTSTDGVFEVCFRCCSRKLFI